MGKEQAGERIGNISNDKEKNGAKEEMIGTEWETEISQSLFPLYGSTEGERRSYVSVAGQHIRQRNGQIQGVDHPVR